MLSTHLCIYIYIYTKYIRFFIVSGQSPPIWKTNKVGQHVHTSSFGGGEIWNQSLKPRLLVLLGFCHCYIGAFLIYLIGSLFFFVGVLWGTSKFRRHHVYDIQPMIDCWFMLIGWLSSFLWNERDSYFVTYLESWDVLKVVGKKTNISQLVVKNGDFPMVQKTYTVKKHHQLHKSK